VADLFGGGEADNVAATGQRVDEAVLELETATKRIRRLRFMPRVLDIFGSGNTVATCFWNLPSGLRNSYLSSLNEPYSPSIENRLLGQVRGDGD
jgi:hypothetical protein